MTDEDDVAALRRAIAVGKAMLADLKPMAKWKIVWSEAMPKDRFEWFDAGVTWDGVTMYGRVISDGED